MTELKGTKLGETKNKFFEEQPATAEPDSLNLSLKGTILGEKSDFENSLKDKSKEFKIEEQQNSSEDKTTQEEPSDIYDIALKDYSEGDIITGTLISIEKAGVFVDIKYKCEGFISNDELGSTNPNEIKEKLKEGEQISVFILKLESKEGYTILSKKRADWELAWKEAYQAYKLKEVIEVKVINAVKGGLVAYYKDIRGFIPASMVDKPKETNLNDFINKTLPATFVEVDKKRKKIIFSNKLSGYASKNNDAIFDALEVGQVIKGRVSSVKKFGAFVNINNVEGLIHISELSWDRIEKVEDIVTIGDEIDVFILGIDRDNKKISLGLKQLNPDPWETVEETYPIGTICKGTVNRIVTYGAFIKLEKGLEGLIHISELSEEHIKQVEDIISVGSEVTVKILRIIPEEQKIGLSIKQAQNLTEYTTKKDEVIDDKTSSIENNENEQTTEEEDNS